MRFNKIINTISINIVQNSFKVNKKYFYTIVEKNDQKNTGILKLEISGAGKPALRLKGIQVE